MITARSRIHFPVAITFLSIALLFSVEDIFGNQFPYPGRQYFDPDAVMGDFFGWPICGNPDHVFIGSCFDSNHNGVNAGSVAIMKRSEKGWELEQRIYADPGGAHDQFGIIASSGDFLAVGAPYAANPDGVRTGAVYLFRQEGMDWIQIGRLYPQNPVEDMRFGSSIAYDDPHLVISSIPVSDTESAKVFVYIREQLDWKFQSVFSPRYPGDYGKSLAVGNHRIAVGAPQSILEAGKTGVVYFYMLRNGVWIESEILEPSMGRIPSFGESVAFNSYALAVGAPDFDWRDGKPLWGNGIVTIFQLKDDKLWETARLRAWVNYTNRLGATLSMNDDLILAGATNYHNDDIYMQRSYTPSKILIYNKQRGYWTGVDYFESDRGEYTGFAESFFLSENTLWAGAPLARDLNGYHRGCVYSYDISVETATDVPVAPPQYPESGPLHLSRLNDDGVSVNQLYLGSRFALDGDTLVVSPKESVLPTGPWEENGTAILHVYQKLNGDWIKIQEIFPPEKGFDVGPFIALDGDRMLLGSRGWVYERENGVWVYKTALSSLNKPEIYFHTFDIQDDRVAVSSEGLVYIFMKDGNEWRLSHKVKFDLYSHSSDFVKKLILNKPNLYIDTGSLMNGYIYEYRNRKWWEMAVIPKRDYTLYYENTAAFQRNTVVMAAWPFFPKHQEKDSGEAFIFQKIQDQWVFKQKLIEPDLPPYHEFGTAVSLDGTRLAISAPRMKAIFLYDSINGQWSRSQRVDLHQITDQHEEYSTFGYFMELSGDTLVAGGGFHYWPQDLKELFILRIEPKGAMP